MTSPQVPDQRPSHAGLLDKSRIAPGAAQFNAIVVPTHRPVDWLSVCIRLAKRTQRPLVVMCSGAVGKDDVIRRATEADVEVFALNLRPANPLEINFQTSQEELTAASPDRNSDLSMKRNVGLVLARLLGWDKLMFLDDDIYRVRQRHVTALAAALENHNVSALIPKRGFPDNSVVCHANRLGGGRQDVFASASGIGVRINRPDLAFFPKVYNEDWLFFADEAAHHRIARVGESRQRRSDPYDTTGRATGEEFGDLLAEGLYARLDFNKGIWDADISYWTEFIEKRRQFHERVARSLAHVSPWRRKQAARAAESVHAARNQLDKITPDLCMEFMHSWQKDLTNWRSYLDGLPHRDSIEQAFDFLKIDQADWGRSVVT